MGVAYTFYLGAAAIDAGIAGTLTPMPFETLDRMSSGTSMFVGLIGLVAGRFVLAKDVGLRIEAGGGIVSFSGLKAGNPFTEDGRASGALTMPQVRVGVGADYEISRSLLVTVTPAFTYTSAANELDARIDRITRFDVLVGLAYGI
jgi:hypothetical protein